MVAVDRNGDAAGRGEGRVVFVTGEPGIGKTSLVTRFLQDLDASARVLIGTCDDLSIPRPLGPIRDRLLETGVTFWRYRAELHDASGAAIRGA